jgi:tRNA pseudouridine65 synthase
VGEIPEKGSIGNPLKKNKSDLKESARTDFQRMKVWKNFSLARISPQTGRYHQIRRHFEMIKHPLVGDSKYGNAAAWEGFFKKDAKTPRLMLQAESVDFIHPFSKRPLRIQTKEKL